MVVRADLKTAPSDVMQVIKSISVREFFRLSPEIKKKCFWGGKLWTQSSFVETIGNASEEVIRRYVQDQLKVMSISEKSSQQLGAILKARSLAAEIFILLFISTAIQFQSGF